MISCPEVRDALGPYVLGALDPEAIVTPGIFVRRVVQVSRAPRAAA